MPSRNILTAILNQKTQVHLGYEPGPLDQNAVTLPLAPPPLLLIFVFGILWFSFIFPLSSSAIDQSATAPPTAALVG